MSELKEMPNKNLCMFNIAGGASGDSINTLILLQQECPGLLIGRKIEINVLDIDTYGPNYAKRSVEALKQPGGHFSGLNVNLNIILFDWSTPEKLSELLRNKSDWIQICSSEGGLFEYGSDEDMKRNLNILSENAATGTRIVGSIIRDKYSVHPGFLGFAEFSGINVRFLGMEGLRNISAQTGWELESAYDNNPVFVVFSLKKS